jgi:prefoldin subunit 5
MEYLKAKIDELETNNKNNNIRDLYGNITDIKKCSQPRTDRVKDEKCDLLHYFG